MAALQYVDVPGYAAILFRRTYADLSKPGALMDRAAEWLRGTDARWNEQKKQWRFPSGAVLTFGHLEHETDKFEYQGSEVQFCGFDELTQFSATQYAYLQSRLRRTLKLGSIPLRMRAASNPGGVGHVWVRHRFLVSGRAAGRAFVPARLEDNPHLDREEYERSLAELDPVTRAQLRRGDWSIRDKDNALVPEWTEQLAASQTHDVPRPPYFHPYVVGDLGSRDLTVFLFAWWWFEMAMLVVEDELVLHNPSTSDVIDQVRAKEWALWGPAGEDPRIITPDAPVAWTGGESPRRFADCDGRLLTDFGKAKMPLKLVKKADALGKRNHTRASLSRREIVISPKCSTLLLTLESAVWNENRTDYQRAEHTGHADAWDALVYLDGSVLRTLNPIPPAPPRANYGLPVAAQPRGAAAVFGAAYKDKKR